MPYSSGKLSAIKSNLVGVNFGVFLSNSTAQTFASLYHFLREPCHSQSSLSSSRSTWFIAVATALAQLPAAITPTVVSPIQCDCGIYQTGCKHKTHGPSLKLWPTSKAASHVAPDLFNQGRRRTLRCRSDFAAPFIVRHFMLALCNTEEVRISLQRSKRPRE